MKLGAEDIEQCKLFDWIRSKPELEPYCWHMANQRSCSAQQGRILKRMGVRSGVSDIFIAIANEMYNGLFIELKSQKGKVSNNQERFMIDMVSQGYYCTVCFGYEAARKVIEWYLKLEKSS